MSEQHQHLVVHIRNHDEALLAAGSRTQHAHPVGLQIFVAGEFHFHAAKALGIVHARHHAGGRHRRLGPNARRRRQRGELRDIAFAAVDGVEHGRKHIAVRQLGVEPCDLDGNAGTKQRVAFRDTPQRDFPRAAQIQFRLREPERVVVILRAFVGQRARAIGAQILRRHRAPRVAPQTRIERQTAEAFQPRSAPAGRHHGTAGRLPGDLHAGFEQGVPELQTHGIAAALQRQQMQRLPAQRQILAATSGQIHQQFQIGLPMLEHPLPEWRRLLLPHFHAKIRGQFAREVRQRHFHMHANRLPLTKTVQRIVGTHAQLLPGIRRVDVIEGGDLSRKERLAFARIQSQRRAGQQLIRTQFRGRPREHEFTERRRGKSLAHLHLQQRLHGIG